jgi:two-component system NarL family response regulator
MRTRILVADELSMFRAGVASFLLRTREFDVYEVADLEEMKETAARVCPELALIDLTLPPRGGIHAVRWLTGNFETDAIVWSFEPSSESVLGAIRAGASGYLRKEISPRGLVRSLRGALNGEAALSRDLSTLMVDAMHRLDDHDRARQQFAVLSAREREILAHVARGAGNREIAEALTISEFTVKRHVQNILEKLDVSSRSTAAEIYRSATATASISAVRQ